MHRIFLYKLFIGYIDRYSDSRAACERVYLPATTHLLFRTNSDCRAPLGVAIITITVFCYSHLPPQSPLCMRLVDIWYEVLSIGVVTWFIFEVFKHGMMAFRSLTSLSEPDSNNADEKYVNMPKQDNEKEKVQVLKFSPSRWK